METFFEARLSWSLCFPLISFHITTAVTFLVLFWLRTDVHAEWMVGWLTLLKYLPQGQSNLWNLDSLRLYMMVSGPFWSRDNMFPIRRLRKAEVPSSKTKQVLFTVLKTLTKKTKKKIFPQMFFQLSASHFDLVTSWVFFRCLYCTTYLGSLNFFACFSTPKASTCTFGLLLTHKVLPTVGLSKPCFLTDSYHSDLSTFWLHLCLLGAWAINLMQKSSISLLNPISVHAWHSCINTLKYSNGLLSLLITLPI